MEHAENLLLQPVRVRYKKGIKKTDIEIRLEIKKQIIWGIRKRHPDHMKPSRPQLDSRNRYSDACTFTFLHALRLFVPSLAFLIHLPSFPFFSFLFLFLLFLLFLFSTSFVPRFLPCFFLACFLACLLSCLLGFSEVISLLVLFHQFFDSTYFFWLYYISHSILVDASRS